MNDRIKQLAEQAGITLSQKDFSYYWVESAEDIGKFAELIVRECAIIAFEEWQHNNTSGESAILKHFGVE